MLDKVVIVGPNGGWDLVRGGGTRVAVHMAAVLADQGYKVHLAAFQAFDKNMLEETHGVELGDKVHLNYVLNVKRNLLRVPFPVGYGLLAVMLKRMLTNLKPHVIIFNDDAPNRILKIARNLGSKVILYSHFSNMIRARFLSFTLRTDSGNKLDLLLFLSYARKYFANLNAFDALIANSTITRSFLKTVVNSNVEILYPPIDLQKASMSPKDDVIVTLGEIEPRKRHDIALKSLMYGERGRLHIIGSLGPRTYLNQLIDEINRSSLRGRVKISANVSEEEKWRILSRAKIVVHSACFEPFGIAVVEGMASGCVPIVYSGNLSGPWIDIVKQEKYGFGFKDPKELSEKIDMLLNDDVLRNKYSKIAIERARFFDVSEFKQRFLRVVRLK